MHQEQISASVGSARCKRPPSRQPAAGLLGVRSYRNGRAPSWRSLGIAKRRLASAVHGALWRRTAGHLVVCLEMHCEAVAEPAKTALALLEFSRIVGKAARHAAPNKNVGKRKRMYQHTVDFIVVGAG